MLEEFLGGSAWQIAVVLAVVAVVFFGFVREQMPSDIVAGMGVGVLVLAGILSVKDVLGVFSNSAPITVGAMFVLSAALERTGVIADVGRWVASLARNVSPLIAIFALMLGGIVLSAFINNTPVVVILMPVAISLARAVKTPASKLLIPLSYGAILGGMTTLLGTSTNIIVDGVAKAHGLAPFTMFEITGAGAIFAIVGAIYVSVASPWLLPSRDTLASILPDLSSRQFISHVVVPVDSVLIGRTVAEAGKSSGGGFTIIDVFRDGLSLRANLKEVVIKGGDRLVLRTAINEMLELRNAGDVAVGRIGGAQAGDVGPHAFEPVQSAETVVMEGVIGPHSALIGRRLVGSGLARLYGVYVFAVHRRGENVGELGASLRFEVGDTLLLEGPAEGMRRVFDDGMLNNLTEAAHQPVRRSKAPIAIGAVAMVMVLSSFNIAPIEGVALLAAAGVIAFKCIDHKEAYQAISWDILMLIFGMLAIGQAMQTTGAGALLVDQITGLVGPFGPVAVLGAVYVMSSVLTEFMSNNATAILITPIAIGVAQQMGVDPRPFVVAVMFAASASFATPIGYQTNTMVYNAGGYRFIDFVKIGAPLNLIFCCISVFVIPMFWPLG